jgi:glutathione S-transferase
MGEPRRLYHTSFSPSCRKTRMLLDEMGLEFTLIEEPVWQQREEFLKLNPAGDVPVLIDGNGLSLSGSYVVTEYLEEGYQVNSLIGATLGERAEVRRLIHWADNKLLKEVTQPLLHEKFFCNLLKLGQPDTNKIRRAKKMLDDHIAYFETLLAQHEWMASEHFSLADISIAAHISLFDYLGDMPWQRNSKLKQWYALMKSRPSMQKVLKDRVRGMKPPADYENPDF